MTVTDYMKLAVLQAKKAADAAEIPVGAVIVKDGAVIAQACNMRESLRQTYAHAEMLAIEAACEKLQSWRLYGCDMYVTLEPCPMCAGAIIQAKIKSVYFGCYDKKAGAFGTVVDLSTVGLNHNLQIYGGISEDLCKPLIENFFAAIRQKG